MRVRALLWSTGALVLGATGLQAQGPWVRLPVDAGATRLWADSNSWVHHPDSTLSGRLRTIEARVDGRADQKGTIQYMDFNCKKHMYRVRRTEMVDGEKVTGILPDSMGNHGWEAPNTGWLEDLQLKGSCKAKG